MEEAAVRLPLRVLADTHSGWCLSKWLVRKGAQVYNNQRVAVLRSLSSDAVDHALSPREGKLTEFLVAEGERIPAAGPTTPIARIKFCSHSIVFRDLCGICGKDVSRRHFADVAAPTLTNRIPVAYSSNNLSVTRAEAESLASITCAGLLKTRHLSLVLDLDHTLVHATDDPRARVFFDFFPPNADSISIRTFAMRLSAKAQAAGRPVPQCNMFVKLRPHLKEFLRRVSERFELSIYTMGSRPYADQIVRIIDPDRSLFRNRITSREDFAEGRLNQKNLGRLFPCDDSMVLIVDDREDVWTAGTDQHYMPNLLRAKPYSFWSGFSEAYDRSSSGTAPEVKARAEPNAVPNPKVTPVNTAVPTSKGLSDEPKILPNSRPMDLRKLMETLPVARGNESRNGFKSLPADPKPEEKQAIVKGEMEKEKAYGSKSLPSPVAPQVNMGSGSLFEGRGLKLQAANGVNSIPSGPSSQRETNGSSETAFYEASDNKTPSNGLSAQEQETENNKLRVDDIRIPRKSQASPELESAEIASQSVHSSTVSPEAPENGTRTLKVQNLNGPDDLNKTAIKTEGSASNSAISPRVTELASPVANANSIGKLEDGVSEEDTTKMNDSCNSELRATVLECWARDENSEFSGHLLRLAEVLERVHERFFNIVEASAKARNVSPSGARKEANVKEILADMRFPVFQGCVFTFTGLFPLNMVPEDSILWDFATRYGARCLRDFESGVTTHVIANPERGAGTEKARRALVERTAFCVSTSWLEDSMACFERLPELPYSLHPPPNETNWEEYRSNIEDRREKAFALVAQERPATSRADRIAELKRRNSVGVTHEEHLAKRQKLANGDANVDEGEKESAVHSVEQPVVGRVLTGDEINDVLDSLIDI